MSILVNTTSSYSLRKRLVFFFGIILLLFLGLTGLILNQAFRESVEAAVQERLQLQIYALLGLAEPEGDGFYVSGLEDPRFSQIDSGLYGLILEKQGLEVWRSASALNMNLDFLPAETLSPGQIDYGSFSTTNLGQLSYAIYSIIWSGNNTEYLFVVLESSAPTDAEIREFQSSLWFWLGGLTVLLSILLYPLLRWGLSPLKKLADEVFRVEAGLQDSLSGNYPEELQPLSDNLNLLIKSERSRQKRYQNTLDDLAHSLKTPLAVISGVVQDSGEINKSGMNDIYEQVQRMNQIVGYQLKRAAQSSHNPLIGRPVTLRDVILKLQSALDKVYKEKNVHSIINVRPDIKFLGDESDLMEFCGNLMDNAYKYCTSQVKFEAFRNTDGLQIIFTDDGPGIDEAQQGKILERGARADSLKSGQGIGLAVSTEIIASYGGKLIFRNNVEGETRVVVIIP